MPEPIEPTRSALPPEADSATHSTRPPGSGLTSPSPWNGSADYPFLAPPQAPDEIGQLGHYRVLGVLGRGGMGVVFRAEDSHLERLVALKIIRPQFSGNADDRARFQREARAQAKVEHDHVAAIYQVGEDHGVPFLAMPLLKGQSLADELRDQPRPALAEVLRIAREAAEGLAAAHEKGLVHRDVKPANLWLEGPRRRVKVLDFGLARTTPGTTLGGDQTLTQTGAMLGTPAYMSLEQALGQKVDARTDLFSLGVILYEMTTGVRPFQGDSFGSLAVALATETPQPVSVRNPAIPPALSRLIDRLLSSNLEERPASMPAVVDEIRGIESGLGEVAPVTRSAAEVQNPRSLNSPPAGNAPRQDLEAQQGSRRSWRVPVLGLCILALTGAIAGILVWLPKRTEVVENASPAPPESAESLPTPQAPTPAITQKTTPPLPPPTPSAAIAKETTSAPRSPTRPARPIAPAPRLVPVAVLPPRKKAPLPQGQADFELGLKLFLGRDGPKDLDKAASLFRNSAEATNPDGGFYAGWTCNNNLGKPAHFSVATYWYQQAAASGHPLARAVIALAQLDAWDLGNIIDVDLAKGTATIRQVADEVKKLADTADPVAKVIFAEMLAGGHGVARNINQAFALYESAAKLGYAPAQNALGVAYDVGSDRFGHKKDVALAMSWYRPAAEQNDPQAFFNLGEVYRTGRLGEKNEQEAVKWYRKAVEWGNENAMRVLAKQYAEGRGLEKDEREAAYWYRKALDQDQFQVDGGSCVAMQRVADAFKSGVGRPKDARQAAELYRKVAEWKHKKAEAGSVPASYSLGLDLMTGQCGEINEAQGFALIHKAADRGLPRAMNRMGEILWQGTPGIPVDHPSAAAWFRKAADAGDSLAMLNLAEAYAKGDGLARDSQEARRWYQAAARAGAIEGYYKLYLLSKNGEGGERNEAEALKWLLEYAKAGSAPAMYTLGETYEKADGVEKDQKQAIEWYRKAAAAGFPDAVKALERLKA